MGRAVGGGSAAGCGIFGLGGILIAIGIAAWLGSQAISDAGGSGSDDRQTSTTVTAPARTGLPGSEDGRVIVLEAPGPVDHGVVVALSAVGFEPGPIEVTSCLTAVPDGSSAPRCDTTTTAVATVDAQSRFTLQYPVKRVLDIDGTRYDCGAFVAACSLVAHPQKAPDAPLASTPLTFADGLDPSGGERPPEP